MVLLETGVSEGCGWTQPELMSPTLPRPGIARHVGLAAGTRVMTRRGEVLAEALVPGEDVLTAAGGFARVRTVAVARPAGPAGFAGTVRVRRDAFGSARPHRDVLLGGAQQIALEDGSARPVASLVDDERVLRDGGGAPRLVEVTLDQPTTLLVDGLPVLID